MLRRFDLDISDQDDLDDNTDISSDDVNCPGVPAREEVPCLAEIDTCDLSANQAKGNVYISLYSTKLVISCSFYFCQASIHSFLP